MSESTLNTGVEAKPIPSASKVAIAHDYLQQAGGAERVVAEWSRALPESTIHTLAYRAGATYPDFGDRDIHPKLHNNFLTHKVEFLLPLLPAIARSIHINEADVALVSSSGWAHQFTYTVPTIAYVHSPARWLYESADYRRDIRWPARTALNLFSGHLRGKDAPSMARMDKLFANSRTTQDRIHRVYGLDSEVLHPPVSAITAAAQIPLRLLPETFALVVSRFRGYKNIVLAIESAKLARMPIVIVGAGTETLDNPGESVFALGMVPDRQLRWLYQQASVLIGSSHEDFGLTPLEANCEGTPVAAIPLGGYLESVSPGTSGILSADETPQALSAAIADAVHLSPNDCREHAALFSAATHMKKLMASVVAVAKRA